MSGAAAGAGAAANVIGGIVQMIAAKKAGQEMYEATQREMDLQNKFRNQAFTTFQPAVGTRGVETAREQIGAGADQRQDFYGKVGQSKLGLNEQKSNRGQAQYQLSGQNRANLGGYSDWALQQMISSIRTQDELNRLSSFAGGQAQVFPYKMSDAQHSQDNLAAIGGLISSIGGSAPAWSSFSGAPQQQQKPMLGGWGENFGSQYSGQA